MPVNYSTYHSSIDNREELNRYKREDGRSFEQIVRSVFKSAALRERNKRERKIAKQEPIPKKTPSTFYNLVGQANQNFIDLTKLERTSLNGRLGTNPEELHYAPKIKTILGDYLDRSFFPETKRNIENGLLTIFGNNTTEAYRNFIDKTKKWLEAKISMIQNFINRYAQKNNKKKINLTAVDLNEKTIDKLVKYYEMDSQVASFIKGMNQRCERSLSDLIHKTYMDMLRRPENLN